MTSVTYEQQRNPLRATPSLSKTVISNEQVQGDTTMTYIHHLVVSVLLISLLSGCGKSQPLSVAGPKVGSNLTTGANLSPFNPIVPEQNLPKPAPVTGNAVTYPPLPANPPPNPAPINPPSPPTPPSGHAGMTIGGWYTTKSRHCAAINNPKTGGQSCPTGFSARLFSTQLCNAADPATRKTYLCEGT